LNTKHYTRYGACKATVRTCRDRHGWRKCGKRRSSLSASGYNPAPCKRTPRLIDPRWPGRSPLYPGLFAGPTAPGEAGAFAGARGPTTGWGRGDMERLFALFGIAPEAGQDLPVAAVTRVADMGVIDREWWIRADPVYLEAGHDSLVLHAGLGLTPDEAAQLVAELNES